MTKAGLSQIVSLITEEYGTVFSQARLLLWEKALVDLSDDQGREAVVRLIQSSPYPPKASDIRRMIFGSPQDRERQLDEEAERAIAHIERYVCDHRMVDLGLTLNATVRALGGIDAVLAMMESGAWRFERSRARVLYRAFRRRGVQGEEGSVLVPRAMAEHLAQIPLSVYQERGIPLPIIRAPFDEEEAVLALEPASADWIRRQIQAGDGESRGGANP